MAKKITLWILTLALGLSTARAALACSCAPPPEPAQELANSDAVFTGTVLAVVPNLEMTRKTVTFRLEKTWKGAQCSQMTLSLTTGFDDFTCGYAFEIGQTYLVYASLDGGNLQTNICTRTRPLSEAGDDLTALGAPQEECTGS